MTPADALARYVELATSFDGLNARDNATEFARVCAPNGPPSAGAYFLAPNLPGVPNSSCEVVAAGILSLLFAELGLPYLQEPLDSALGEWSRLTSLARVRGALRSPEDPGDGIRVGCIVHCEGAGTGRHWWTVTRQLGTDTWLGVDGGHVVDGYQAIHCRVHTMRRYVYDVTSSKPVANFVDVGALLAALMPAVDSDPADASLDGGPL